MKITLAQLNYHVANIEHNRELIIRQIDESKKLGADLVVFSELAICGYPPLDFLEQHRFVEECIKAIGDIARYCENIAAIVGGPAFSPLQQGKKLMNAAWFLEDGKIKDVVYKSLLPTYDVFDEYRYFEPNNEFHCIVFGGKKIALSICEDLWDEHNEKDAPLNHSKMYRVSPMEELRKENPDIIINIAASPFAANHFNNRMAVLSRHAKDCAIPLVYVNQAGANTELIFDGGSLVLNHRGELINQPVFFNSHSETIDLNALENQEAVAIHPHELEHIHDALVFGIRDFFSKQGFTKAILGLSGGIDSALVLYLACKALGAENVLPVMLPGPYSSEHSISDSIDLCNKLSCQALKIPIEPAYETMLNSLSDAFANSAFGIAEENIQARLRGLTLMALSNKFGHILLNTTNKSEMAVGYGTLYGDMCGGLSVIGDVYKTKVFELCHFINRKGIIIPENIITKAPSAELRPNQKDEDSLPPYSLLDEILELYIERKQTYHDIVNHGMDKQLVRKVLDLVNRSEYKRKQTAPILRISQKAFGPGRRMPIVANYQIKD
jgi:NAD+ synthase (glutamine-hydrolysing)